jgi:hypothetical protein
VTARDDILNVVRGGAAAAIDLPNVPDFCSAPADLDGKAIFHPPSGIQQWVSTAFPNAQRVYSAVGEVSVSPSPAQSC